jgi:hypothetical protein
MIDILGTKKHTEELQTISTAPPSVGRIRDKTTKTLFLINQPPLGQELPIQKVSRSQMTTHHFR